MDELLVAGPAATVRPSTALTAIVVSADGVRQMVATADLRELVTVGKFFWIDIIGSNEAACATLLRELGLEDADITWARRFGQLGCMVIDRQRLRTVTWLAEHHDVLTEIHLLCTGKFILTVWNGDGRTLDEIREHFAECAGELQKSPYQAAGIVLQLLLGTLHREISELDVRLQDLRDQLYQNPSSLNFATLTDRLRKLQSAWSDIDRYSSAVRTGIVGIEALPGIDKRSVAGLNEYAAEVEDVEHRLQERSRWGSDILQDYSAAIAQRQGEQINRLTIVSLIFLPITFLTGFFGMNFNWMIEALGSLVAFVVLGLLLPASSVLLTVLWLRRRGL